jgi:hypothetical protein
MPIYRKSGGSWTTIRNIYRKSNGVWTSIENVYRKAGGVWNSVFLRNNSPVIQNRVTISSNVSYIADGETATLTGRNYSWTPTSGLTLTYRFEKSTSITFATSTLVASGSIANPASGSSNTVTRSISPSDFSQTDMYFRFRVTAVNSSGTTVSLSDIVGVSYYGTPVPQSPYPEITGSTTVGNNAFGNIGVWTNSPTQYDYRWFFNSGLSSYPLTFSQSRSVTNKSLSGFTATLTTSDAHKYKVSDTAIITSVDSLLNKSLATITAVTNNTFSYTITTPTAWSDAGTSYSSGSFVSFGGNVYAANQSISSVSAYSGGTFYNLGQIVYANSNRYQSKTSGNQGNSFTNTTHWTDLGSFAPGGSRWTIQNFSNAAASGTTTGPNYYEGSVVSSTSILLVTPTTDYKTSIDLRGAVLGFGVEAYNPATSNPSEYTGNRFIYGIPVITVGTITTGSTTASIPYTQSYMTEYDIDIKYAGSSISGYPRTVTSPSTPISITGLLAPREYSYTISPKNGEKTFGAAATGTFNTVVPPSGSTFLRSNTSTSPSQPSTISLTSSNNSNNQVTASWTNGTPITSVTYTGTGAGLNFSGTDTTSPFVSTNTSSYSSTGTYTFAVYNYNSNGMQATFSWNQSSAQSYRITYNHTVLGTGLTISGNNSNSSVSVPISLGSAGSLTWTDLTLYSQQNQSGISTSYSNPVSGSISIPIPESSRQNEISLTFILADPTGLYSDAVAKTDFFLGWTKSTTATSYDYGVNQSTSSPPTTQIFSGNPTNGQFRNKLYADTNAYELISSLTPSTTYYGWVRAKNSFTSSNWVRTGSVTTLALKPPGSVTNLQHDSASRTTTSLKFTWTAPAATSTNNAAQTYQYYYDTSSTATPSPTYETSDSTTNVTIGGSFNPLSSNTTYYFWVRGKNSDGSSASWTGPASGTTLALSNPPGAPTGAALTVPSTSGITLGWTKGGGGNPTTYEVAFSTSTTAPTTTSSTTPINNFYDIGGTATSYRVSGLNVGTTYYAWVRAKNNDGTSANSNRPSLATRTITITNPKWNTTSPSNFERNTGSQYMRWGWNNGTATTSGSGAGAGLTLDGFYYEIYTTATGTTLWDSGFRTHRTTNATITVNGTNRIYVQNYNTSSSPVYTTASRFGRIQLNSYDSDFYPRTGSWTARI